MDSGAIIAIVGPIAAALGAVITSFTNRRKNNAEASQIAAQAADQVRETYGKIIEAQDKRIAKFDEQLSSTEKDLFATRRLVGNLVSYIDQCASNPEQGHPCANRLEDIKEQLEHWRK